MEKCHQSVEQNRALDFITKLSSKIKFHLTSGLMVKSNFVSKDEPASKEVYHPSNE